MDNDQKKKNTWGETQREWGYEKNMGEGKRWEKVRGEEEGMLGKKASYF